MKAYKATYNGKCLDITYEVGNTYTLKGKLIMCERGFHFCENFEDLTKWYYFIKNNKYDEEIKVFKIEAQGKIIEDIDKSVTNKIKIIRELSQEEIFEKLKNIFKFDKNNNIIWEKGYGKEYYWKYKYDDHNNKIWEKDFNGNIYEWGYKYDDNNNLIWKQFNNKDIWEYKYDENNNKICEKSPSGNIWEYQYDDNNNLIWEKLPSGDISEWEYKYDDQNNIIWEKFNIVKEFYWEYKYDDKGNIIWQKSPSGDIDEWEYTDSKIIKKVDGKITEEITIS